MLYAYFETITISINKRTSTIENLVLIDDSEANDRIYEGKYFGELWDVLGKENLKRYITRTTYSETEKEIHFRDGYGIRTNIGSWYSWSSKKYPWKISYEYTLHKNVLFRSMLDFSFDKVLEYSAQRMENRTNPKLKYDMPISKEDIAIIEKYNNKDPFLGTFFYSNIIEYIKTYTSLLDGNSWNSRYLISKECINKISQNPELEDFEFIKRLISGCIINYTVEDFTIRVLNAICEVIPICKEMEKDENNWYEIFKKNNYKYKTIMK